MGHRTDNSRELTPGLPVVVILGATATGKTGLALRLADRLDIEIVNADSRYLYRGMDIGTAKPDAAEQRRLPHHLIDILEPDESYSLARFLDDAYAAVEDIGSRGNLPVVAGGTPQYLRAFIEGWTMPRVPPDEELRERLDGGDAAELFDRLSVVDPASAERIGPTNKRRMIRALEVYEKSGIPMSEQSGKQPPPYCMILVGLRLDRDALYERIDARARWMFGHGILQEAQRLLPLDPGLPALSSIGYPEARAAVLGEIDVETAIERASFSTHRYARHQATWFRRFTGVHWFDAASPTLTDDVATLISTQMDECPEDI
jgi:tRNA dimethylallyltransferase